MSTPKRNRTARPRAPRRSWAAKAPLALAGSALLLSSYCAELRPDELECEHAMAHLLDCCPELVLDHDDCVFDTASCSSTNRDPILTEDDSICIQELSCIAIQDRGLCEAVQERSDEPNPEGWPGRLCY